MKSKVLPALLNSQQDNLNALAKIWLDNGATQVSLWQNGAILAQWPELCQPEKNGLAASINVNGKKLAEFHVAGMDNSRWHLRLQTEVNLIAQMISLEEELDTLTAELIDNQDQLLALYNLTRSTRSQLEIDQALRVLTQETKRLVKAEGVFILLTSSGQIGPMAQNPAAFLGQDIVNYVMGKVDNDTNERLLRVEDVPFSLATNVTSLFLKNIPIRDETTAVMGVLLNRSTASVSPCLKLVRAIADYAGSQLKMRYFTRISLNRPN